MPSLSNANNLTTSPYDWAQGLSSAPDVPHTELSVRKTEGSGVGVFTEPPVRNSSESKAVGPSGVSKSDGVGEAVNMFAIAQKLIAEAVNLSFMVRRPGKSEMVWDSILVGGVLLINVPGNALLEATNDSFVKVLDYAEEVMRCSKVVVCFKKTRQDRNLLIKTFMFHGFSLISPSFGGSHGDLLYMSYSLGEEDQSSDEE